MWEENLNDNARGKCWIMMEERNCWIIMDENVKRWEKKHLKDEGRGK